MAQESVFDITKCPGLQSVFPVSPRKELDTNDDGVADTDPDGFPSLWLVNAGVPQAPKTLDDCLPTQPILPPPEPPCPTLSVQTVQFQVVDLGLEEVRFSIVKRPRCEFDFNLEVDFPCPQIQLAREVDTSQGLVQGRIDCFQFEKQDGSQWDYCILQGTTQIVEKGQEEARLVLAKRTDACAFDFHFEIDFPSVCPQLQVAREVDTDAGLRTGEVSCAQFVKSTGSQWDYCLLQTPVEFVEGNREPKLTLVIQKKPDECVFEWHAQVEIPCPQLQGVLDFQSVQCDADPYVDFQIVQNAQGCGHQAILQLQIPKPDCQQCTAQFVDAITGASLTQQCAIQIDYTTAQLVYKCAVVPSRSRYLGLHCIESPEVWFFDLLTVNLLPGVSWKPLDPDFVEVCEPDSIRLVSLTPERLTQTAGAVVGDSLRLESERPATAQVMVAGIRRGAVAERFPEHTREEMERNNRFWAQASQAKEISCRL